MFKKFTIDISPLRKYRDFRLLWASGLVSYLGSMFTYVALPFQIKLLTNSYIAVGIMGAVELIPLIVFGLYGGVLADSVDRKKLVWATEFLALFISLVLFLNSSLHKPHLLLLYICGAAFAAVDGLQRPSLDAILPRIVEHKDLPNASALMSLRSQFGVIAGPALAGILISTLGVSAGFLVDVFSYVISLIFLWKVSAFPPHEKNPAPTMQSLIAGIKYATSRKDLLGTYVIDLLAMFFAMPTALFPFWADQIHARWALGFFYAAGTIGSIVVTLTSRWINNYPYHGRAIAYAAIAWGGAISLAGVSRQLWLIIFFLALAGGADMISALFRSAIWNQSIPDEYRGRLAGIQLLSYSVGPLGGQMRAGSVAAWTSLRTSVISGGLLCIGLVSIATAALADFRKYDVRSKEEEEKS
jgi:MFS family permease